MYLIAGLGNPSSQYENTRHNVGFDAIDYVAKENNISIDTKKHKALIGKGVISGQKVILAKPQTFMNLSGESIREIVNYYNINPETQLLVLFDDISLDVGRIRIRKKGSAGGHNGIKNIISQLGTQNFARVKIGVGDKPVYMDLVDYVLGHFSREERKIINEAICNVEEITKLILQDDFDRAMNLYN